MAKLKYAIHPGRVKSQWDGEIHYISSDRLMRLYGVEPKECVVVRDNRGHRNYEDLKHLYPKPDGDYNIDDEK